jgi:hypothetical protein
MEFGQLRHFKHLLNHLKCHYATRGIQPTASCNNGLKIEVYEEPEAGKTGGRGVPCKY